MKAETPNIGRQGTSPINEQPRNLVFDMRLYKWKPKNLKEKRLKDKLISKHQKSKRFTLKVDFTKPGATSRTSTSSWKSW